MITRSKTFITKQIPACVLALSLVFALPGCNASRTQKGGAIGAGAGGAIGGAIGSRSDNTAVGAIIGATIGGAAGAIIGRHMDKQAEELERDLEDAQVERVGEGIKITFDSGLLFAVDSENINASTEENLMSLSNTLKDYEDTEILIEGHTDATGPEDYNEKLSNRRAESVRRFLTAQGVDPSRMTAVGYGENQPIADNETPAGKQSNRRVEVAIYANDEMKRAAKRGELTTK